MSCSALYFSNELKVLQSLDIKDIKYINASVVNCMSKYGIHMIDATLGWLNFNPTSIRKLNLPFESIVIDTEENIPIQINALGNGAKTFDYNVYTSNENFNFQLLDNFTYFRSTLSSFAELLTTGIPFIPAKVVEKSINTLIHSLNLLPGQDVFYNRS